MRVGARPVDYGAQGLHTSRIKKETLQGASFLEEKEKFPIERVGEGAQSGGVEVPFLADGAE